MHVRDALVWFGANLQASELSLFACSSPSSAVSLEALHPGSLYRQEK